MHGNRRTGIGGALQDIDAAQAETLRARGSVSFFAKGGIGLDTANWRDVRRDVHRAGIMTQQLGGRLNVINTQGEAIN